MDTEWTGLQVSCSFLPEDFLAPLPPGDPLPWPTHQPTESLQYSGKVEPRGWTSLPRASQPQRGRPEIQAQACSLQKARQTPEPLTARHSLSPVVSLGGLPGLLI